MNDKLPTFAPTTGRIIVVLALLLSITIILVVSGGSYNITPFVTILAAAFAFLFSRDGMETNIATKNQIETLTEENRQLRDEMTKHVSVCNSAQESLNYLLQIERKEDSENGY